MKQGSFTGRELQSRILSVCKAIDERIPPFVAAEIVDLRSVPVGEISFLLSLSKLTGAKSSFEKFANYFSHYSSARASKRDFYSLQSSSALVVALGLANERDSASPFSEFVSVSNLNLRDAFSSTSKSNLDYLYGRLGAAYLSLLCKDSESVPMIHEILAHLRNHASAYCYPLHEFSRSWARENPVTSEVDLGIPHGNAGLLTVLSYAARNGVPFTAADLDLIKQIAYRIVATRGKGSSMYPYKLDGECNTRIGWCYGDLSIAIGLGNIYALTKDHVLLQEIAEITAGIEKRIEPNFVLEDPFLCHGSGGLLMALTFLSDIGVPIRSDFVESVAIGTVSQIETLLEKEIDVPTDILNGLTGIGLCLISYAGTGESHWRRLFFM